jgi:hypothetical protein
VRAPASPGRRRAPASRSVRSISAGNVIPALRGPDGLSALVAPGACSRSGARSGRRVCGRGRISFAPKPALSGGQLDPWLTARSDERRQRAPHDDGWRRRYRCEAKQASLMPVSIRLVAPAAERYRERRGLQDARTAHTSVWRAPPASVYEVV